MILLGPIGGAVVVAISNARNVERSINTERAPFSDFCLFTLTILGFCWWLTEWLSWGFDNDEARLGALIGFSPLTIILICGAIWGK
jgi:hypothetical protein